ncbi:uncharacterized protein F4822DRAFT_406568 [Hypoxylon trugodes]|uniref:uncharacterized protein n=1 Tax=Hypoxylon trugodes TaxID=326681 RepID=UPI002193B836|nr:uncharacterized protein F4822DRAFT_406568 [Hypoxylon trugodes]KAI1387460.1 hypothetical protein F4822DRAFT_406568 [Hypoxylon trugodes]
MEQNLVAWRAASFSFCSEISATFSVLVICLIRLIHVRCFVLCTLLSLFSPIGVPTFLTTRIFHTRRSRFLSRKKNMYERRLGWD